MTPEEQRSPTPKERAQKALGAVAAAAVTVAKLGGLVFKVKFLGLALSMLVSVAGYMLFFGWTFAVGLVLLVLVHELGHMVLMRSRGYATGLPVFVPFFGAFVKGSKEGATPYDGALASLAGPFAGALAAMAVVGLGEVYDSEFLNALGYFGLLLNLFNLAPIGFLDGHEPGRALRFVEWVPLLAVMLLVELQEASAALPILIILGGYRAYRSWRHPEPHGLLPDQRRTVVLTYVGIIAVSLLVMHGHQPAPRHL